jgi:hypothetical protein
MPSEGYARDGQVPQRTCSNMGAMKEMSAPVKPVLVEEPAIDWSVLILYVIIVLVLGTALVYSLNLGKDYLSFSSAIVTALTTIAGFAVGANAGPAKTP